MLTALDEHGDHAYEHAGCSPDSPWDAAMVLTRDGVLACRRCGYRGNTQPTGMLIDGFDITNRQWGLRGSPFVWATMRDTLGDVPTPSGLVDFLYDRFAAIADVDLRSEREEFVVREKFAHGGMSSGGIHLGWWRDKGIPPIAERARR